MVVTVNQVDPIKCEGLSDSKIKQIVNDILKKEKRAGWMVEISFICDRKMKSLNKKYRRKDKTTDVLSFEMGEDRVLGDVFISKAEASKNAKKYGVLVKDEIVRILTHGVLHLLGYKHGAKMFKRQEQLLCRVS